MKRIFLYIIIFIVSYAYAYRYDGSMIEPLGSLYYLLAGPIGNDTVIYLIISSFIVAIVWIFLDKQLKKLID